MPNFYQIFKELLPDAPLLVGVVDSTLAGGYTVSLPGGGTIFARGVATIGQTVFVRDGVIEGAAPSLSIETIEV